MADLPLPASPFADWPIQAVDSAGYSWYTESGVFVTQAHVVHATFPHALSMTKRVDTVVRLRREEFVKLGGLLIIHDWRKVKSWDNEARNLLFDRARQRDKGVFRAVVIAVSVNPLLGLLANVINVTNAAVGGARFNIVTSLTPTLETHSVQKPLAGVAFPGEG